MRWLPLERIRTKPAANNLRSASDAVRRGSLATHNLQRGCKDGLGVQSPEFGRLHCLDVEFCRFAQIRQRFLNRICLRVTTLKFRAISKNAVFILFNNGRELTDHKSKLRG